MIIEVVGKEIEKIKGDFESYLNGLNMVGEISYSQYSELYDEGTKQIQKAYELGKSELEKENAKLKNKLEHRNCLDCSNHSSKLRMKTLELEKECANVIWNLLSAYTTYADSFDDRDNEIVEEAVQFLSEVEKWMRF